MKIGLSAVIFVEAAIFIFVEIHECGVGPHNKFRSINPIVAIGVGREEEQGDLVAETGHEGSDVLIQWTTSF